MRDGLRRLFGALLPAPDARVGDARVVAPDQQDAALQVGLVVRVRSAAPRADLLAAVRHELRLPLGPRAVPRGALHLERADDASVTVASLGAGGSRFRAELALRDEGTGCSGAYAVHSWHRRCDRICGVAQLRDVRERITTAVRQADPAARLDEIWPSRNPVHRERTE